jgi:hypothetical protein
VIINPAFAENLSSKYPDRKDPAVCTIEKKDCNLAYSSTEFLVVSLSTK